MRCRSCDCELTDFEATRRYADGGAFIDLCGRCMAPIVAILATSERFELFDPDIDTIDWETETDTHSPADSGDEPDED